MRRGPPPSPYSPTPLTAGQQHAVVPGSSTLLLVRHARLRPVSYNSLVSPYQRRLAATDPSRGSVAPPLRRQVLIATKGTIVELAVALGSGLLIGVERERRKGEGEIWAAAVRCTFVSGCMSSCVRCLLTKMGRGVNLIVWPGRRSRSSTFVEWHSPAWLHWDLRRYGNRTLRNADASKRCDCMLMTSKPRRA